MKKEIEFLSNKYIVMSAVNWFGFGITFNQAPKVRAAYYTYQRENITSEKTQDQMFEDFLFEYIEQDKINKALNPDNE